jgi:hypothetical protein
MSKAPKSYGALTRSAVRRSADYARIAIVLGCAAALILAGQALPV